MGAERMSLSAVSQPGMNTGEVSAREQRPRFDGGMWVQIPPAPPFGQ